MVATIGTSVKVKLKESSITLNEVANSQFNMLFSCATNGNFMHDKFRYLNLFLLLICLAPGEGKFIKDK